ncbi:MAG: hypothetical protein ACOH1H_02600 [Brevundimonas sp.]
MSDATAFRPPDHGLHPRHYDALRHEILRTGAELSNAQLRDLTGALDRQVRGRHPTIATPRSAARAAIGARPSA